MQSAERKEVGGGEIETLLPPQQQQVLELLVAGKSVAATARKTGVGRRTVYKWLKNDPAFTAAYNQWQQEMSQTANNRMLTLMEKAADALEKSLDAGDGRLGLRVLEKMGAAKAPELKPKEEKVSFRVANASLNFLTKLMKDGV